MPSSWLPSIVWIDAFGAGVFSMTLVHHLDLWWRRRDRASHLWIASSALGALLVNLSGAAIRVMDGASGRWLSAVNMLGVALALGSLFELVRANAGQRAGRARRVLQAACVLPGILYAATGNLLLVPLLYLLALTFLLGAFGLVLRDALSGDVEARVLGVGLSALFLTLVFDIAASLGAFPRHDGWPILGFSLLYVAATRAQSIREEREYGELLSLRGDLERRVRQRTTELEAANAHLDRLSRTDLLTGLANRRSLVEQVAARLQDPPGGGRAGCLVMIDIDHFKQINDDFGHDAGDRVLVQAGGALLCSFGEGALIARWGGEEFIVHLPQARLDDACQLAEAARAAIAGLRAGPADERALSASFGVAEFGREPDFAQTLAAADAALYRAKREGRNRVLAAGA